MATQSYYGDYAVSITGLWILCEGIYKNISLETGEFLLPPSWESFVSLLPKNANIKYTKLFGMGVKLGLSRYRKNTEGIQEQGAVENIWT